MGVVPSAQVEPTDAEAIRASLTDREAFGLIFERYFSLLYWFLSLRVGAESATDLAAEAFAIAFRRRADFDAATQSARPWLFGIAVNLARQHDRGERRLREALARFHLERPEETMDEVSMKVDASRTTAALREALRGLSPDDRELLLLFACVGLSYDEIAQSLALPVGTVRSRLHRIRTKLRLRLSRLTQEVIN